MSNAKVVDLYLPLDARENCNETIKPVAWEQVKHIEKVINELGWKVNFLNTPDNFISSVAMGIATTKKATASRFINFMAGWTYPDFTVTPMSMLPAETPKLLLGSAIPDYPGAVGLLAAAGGLSQVGIETSRIFVQEFDKYDTYKEQLKLSSKLVLMFIQRKQLSKLK